MVPNNIVLSAAVVPLREPAAVDLRARLRPDVMPSQVQTLLEEGISTPVRGEPHIALEEIDREEVVVRVAATPVVESDGPRLADEVLSAIASVTREVPAMNGVEPADDLDGSGRDPQQVTAERDGRREAGELTAERDGRRHETVTQEYES
jgi:hypothetical protein